MAGSETHLTAYMFLAPRVHITNDTSIGSSIFAWLTVVTQNVAIHTCGVAQKEPKIKSHRINLSRTIKIFLTKKKTKIAKTNK